MDDLTDTEREMLAFEKLTWVSAGAREAAITERFGMKLTQYYLAKDKLIDKPEAWAAEPALVKRLRALRDARRALRSGKRLSQ